MPTTTPKPKINFGGAVLILGDRAYAPGPNGTVLTCPVSHWLQNGTDTVHFQQPIAIDPGACGPKQMAMLTMIREALDLAEISLL